MMHGRERSHARRRTLGNPAHPVDFAWPTASLLKGPCKWRLKKSRSFEKLRKKRQRLYSGPRLYSGLSSRAWIPCHNAKESCSDARWRWQKNKMLSAARTLAVQEPLSHTPLFRRSCPNFKGGQREMQLGLLSRIIR